MRHVSMLAGVAFLAGLSVGYCARGSSANGQMSVSKMSAQIMPAPGLFKEAQGSAEDLAGIEKLHKEDIEVTLLQDPKGLVDIWTEDGVRLLPGRPAEVGKKAIETGNQNGRAEHPGFHVVNYRPEFKELQVVDGWAFEWGSFEASYRLSPEGPVASFSKEFLRVLKRQSDGSWKFARVMLN